jgi:hypothetical protein
MRRLLPAITLAVASVAVATGASQAHGSAGCLASNETRNSWHAVPTPVAGAHVASDAQDPCSMTAADDDGRTWSTADGGATWTQRGTVPAHVQSVYRAGLPTDVVLARPQGAGLYISRDNGTNWSAAGGMTGITLVGLSVEPDNRTGVWAAGSHTASAPLGGSPTGSVFSSSDGGSTWSEDARGLPIHPTVSARVGPPYDAVFANDTRSGQLWERQDSGAFTPVYQDSVNALAVSPLKGGGSELYVAGAAGVAVTRDGGTTFSTMASGAATAVAAEFNHYTAFMYVSGGRVRRSTNAGHSSRVVDAGLPGGCDPTSLVGDRGDPSTFLATCRDGSTYRYRSDGSDLSDADTVTSDTYSNSLLGTSLTAKPMPVLGVRKLPHSIGDSASIAFDGTYLYYATSSQPGLLHRIVAATGKAAPDMRLARFDNGIIAMTYDSKRHVLYVAANTTDTYAVTLRTGAVRRMFSGPYSAGCCGSVPTGSLTYDTSSDEFIHTDDQATSLGFFSRTGGAVRTCNVQGGGLVGGGQAIAAVVATGDGGVYAEGEDDATVYRLDASCHITAEYQHDVVSEAHDENDAIACDTITFGQAAIWIRDSGVGTATAYGIPDGYCALSTTLAVTAPPSVSTGSAGTVCAVLRRLGTGAPIPSAHVQLFVANRLIGDSPTNSAGRTCASYTPTAAEAGRRASVSSALTTHARQPVVGTFLGTIAFRPATAHAGLAAIDPGQAVPLPPPPQPGQLPGATLAVAAPPVIVAPPPPPAPPAPQVQPLPQAHPGAQPLGQSGAAFQQQDEAQAATAENARDEFHARPAPAVAPDLRVVLPVGVLLAAAVARRRRASRVRGQPT